LFVAIGLLYNHESPLRPPNYLSARVARAAAAASKGQLRRLTLGDLSAERDWSDARDFVRGFWLALQNPAAGDYVFASGHSRQALDLVDTAFQAVRLDFREYIHWTPGDNASRPKLRGNPAKAEAVLGWRREWRFEETIGDMVRAELEDRTADERADPTPARK
ncbi:MAG: NAD-dependent epimerase/dehydratase family protein, partial [Rhodocyclaceae bacterium]|nr:NAD-dependent epimerase/dehydratase family protein [Rhodocyclaceae bacterium]